MVFFSQTHSIQKDFFVFDWIVRHWSNKSWWWFFIRRRIIKIKITLTTTTTHRALLYLVGQASPSSPHDEKWNIFFFIFKWWIYKKREIFEFEINSEENPKKTKIHEWQKRKLSFTKRIYFWTIFPFINTIELTINNQQQCWQLSVGKLANEKTWNEKYVMKRTFTGWKWCKKKESQWEENKMNECKNLFLHWICWIPINIW